MEKKIKDIFLFPANIVTLARIFLFMLALIMLSYGISPIIWFSVLFISDLGDALDGYLARKRNESSRIGQILDFTSDRLLVIGAMFVLSLFFSKFWVLFFLVGFLDITAHYLYLKTVYEIGQIDHKKASSCCPLLIRWYYKNKTTLFLACSLHDLFFGLLLLSHFIEINLFYEISLYALSIFALLKITIHCEKIRYCLVKIAQLDTEDRKGLEKEISNN